MQEADKARLDEAVAAIQSVLSGPVGIYNYGSAQLGGLRPSSDIDLLVVIDQATTTRHRRDLVRELLRSSGRPVEVTIVRADRIKPWRMPPEREFQYGEWLRVEYESGQVPGPEVDFDLVALLATALTASVAIVGPPLPDLLDPISAGDLVSAMIDSIPALLGDLAWDPANGL
ncbi:MAG TPA: nucleotidyltransferase domain-containing protein, partial [Acidimicrobiia bacterium]|nr:nucleotidyltransferase domain-containing protein [Acidimicrobiia bacterium]